MNSVELDRVLKDQIKRTINILGSKAGEYATDDERLHNFKILSALQGITLRQAVVNLMAKHTVSIFDMASNEVDLPEELWNEKITDHINYLILLLAVLEEERKEKFRSESYPNQDLINMPLRTMRTPQRDVVDPDDVPPLVP
jgi:hypothetical protein